MSSESTSTDDGAVAPVASRTPTRVAVVAWVLTLVALAPVVTVLVLVWRVLRGSLDSTYFGSYTEDGEGVGSMVVPAGITFWDRWSVLASAVPHENALLTTTGVSALLAALHLAGGSRWPLGRPLRWAAAGVAWLAAAVAVAVLGLTLVEAEKPASEASYAYYAPDLLTLLVPSVAMAVVAAFAVVAGILLVGPAAPAPPESAHEDVEDVEDGEDGEDEVRVAEVPEEPRSEAEAPGAAPVDASREAGPGGFPHPTAEEYAAYRRPGS